MIKKYRMKENLQYISHVKVIKLWGRLDFDWSNINEDVNIIVGINGSGKTIKSVLAFDGYDAILRIKSDVGLLKNLRKNY